MSKKEPKWEDCYKKWDHRLWKRLSISAGRRKKGNTAYGKRYIRKMAWTYLVWKECDYCYKYRAVKPKRGTSACSKCPLYQIKACHEAIHRTTTTNKIYGAWIKNNKKEFEHYRKKFAEQLEETKW